jgi:hypothetical protein
MRGFHIRIQEGKNELQNVEKVFFMVLKAGQSPWWVDSFPGAWKSFFGGLRNDSAFFYP